jgi:hypothetical protein
MARTRHNDGSFTTEENNRLTAFNEARGLVEMDRPTVEEDVDHLAYIHQAAHRRWWRRGYGILSNGVDFRPSQVMAEKERQ